jgi:MFS transporter, DHA2 family, glioxin efflux transporter
MCVSAAQSAFVNVMINRLPSSAPDVDPSLVILTGASEIRSAFKSAQVPGILIAYMAGLKIVFALTIAATGLAFCISLGAKWKRLNTDAIKNGGAAA